MKKKFRDFLLKVPFFERLCRLLTRRHVRAFMYHRFAQGARVLPGRINQETLRTQLRLIAKHHPVVSPADHLQTLAGHSAGSCPVVVTIDDGYSDCYEFAFPVFREFQTPAMLFATTGFVAGTHWFWWDKMAWLIDGADSTVWEFPVLGSPLKLDLSDDSRKSNVWNQLADRCRFIDDASKELMLADLASGFNTPLPPVPPPEYSAATWDQLREMDASSMFIGAHTVTHPILTRISLAEAQFEIEGSRKQLAENLETPVDWFCYPQGGPADFNPEVRAIVAEHFSGCYLAYQEMKTPHDPLALPRYHASDDIDHFRWILCGAEYLALRLNSLLGRNVGPGAYYWAGSDSTEE